jgi:hypothetical protein
LRTINLGAIVSLGFRKTIPPLQFGFNGAISTLYKKGGGYIWGLHWSLILVFSSWENINIYRKLIDLSEGD